MQMTGRDSAAGMGHQKDGLGFLRDPETWLFEVKQIIRHQNPYRNLQFNTPDTNAMQWKRNSGYPESWQKKEIFITIVNADRWLKGGATGMENKKMRWIFWGKLAPSAKPNMGFLELSEYFREKKDFLM